MWWGPRPGIWKVLFSSSFLPFFSFLFFIFFFCLSLSGAFLAPGPLDIVHPCHPVATPLHLMTQCTMFFKVHHSLINLQFPPCIQLHPTSRRASHQLRYIPITAVTDTYKYSFYVRTVPVWNRLPQEAVEATSVNVFQATALPVVRQMQPTATHQCL